MTEPIVEPGTVWAPALVPPPLHRAGAIAWRVLVVVALLAIVIWLSFLLGTVTASILVALIVGATFAPVTRGLRARGWSGPRHRQWSPYRRYWSPARSSRW